MDSTGQARAVYQPSGRVDWVKFVPGLLVAAGAAVLMAWCLFWVNQKGFYYIFVAPLIAALAVGGVWYLVLTWSHCRNKPLATVLSAVLALLLYFGYYHACFLNLVGIRNAHRLDALPRYVQFRMKTDVARDAHQRNIKGARFHGPNSVQQTFNWVFFGLELVAVLGVLVSIGRHCTSKAYCEPCRRWMESETLKLPPGAGAMLWDSLHHAHFADVRQQLADTSRQNPIGGTVTIEHCSTCPAEDRTSSVYLTVKDVPVPGMRDPLAAKLGALFKPRHSAGLRTLVDHVELNAEEVGALVKSFPGLKGTVGTHPELFADTQSAAEEIDRIEDEQLEKWTDRVAEIEDVDPREAGTVLTRGNAVMQTFIGILSAFGLLLLGFVPPGVLSSLESKPPDWTFGIAVGWMAVCLILNLVWCLFFARYPTSRFMLRRTRHAFEMRPDPAVHLDNPDLIFVDIIPRINWGKQMLENATDIGFLELDKGRRELIFEGDRQRYWIPIESIVEVKHEFWAESVQHQLQSSPSLNHVVVVKAMTAAGPWETWFYQRQNHFRMHTAKRRLADAVELESRIRELMSSVS